MRSTLVTPHQLDPEILEYAAERKIPTFRAMNELIGLGIAYYRLFGKAPYCYLHKMEPIRGTSGSKCNYCGLEI